MHTFSYFYLWAEDESFNLGASESMNSFLSLYIVTNVSHSFVTFPCNWSVQLRGGQNDYLKQGVGYYLNRLVHIWKIDLKKKIFFIFIFLRHVLGPDTCQNRKTIDVFYHFTIGERFHHIVIVWNQSLNVTDLLE